MAKNMNQELIKFNLFNKCQPTNNMYSFERPIYKILLNYIK